MLPAPVCSKGHGILTLSTEKERKDGGGGRDGGRTDGGQCPLTSGLLIRRCRLPDYRFGETGRLLIPITTLEGPRPSPPTIHPVSSPRDRSLYLIDIFSGRGSRDQQSPACMFFRLHSLLAEGRSAHPAGARHINAE